MRVRDKRKMKDNKVARVYCPHVVRVVWSWTALIVNMTQPSHLRGTPPFRECLDYTCMFMGGYLDYQLMKEDRAIKINSQFEK